MGNKDKKQQAAPEIIDLHKLTPELTGSFGGKACGLARIIKTIHASGGKGGFFEKSPPLTPQKTFINFKRETKVPRGFAVSAAKIPVEEWSRITRDTFIEKIRMLLENGPIVIRSSAIGEDSVEKSFAGMFETVLNINNKSDALAAANHCIASGNSERVKKYANTKFAVPVGLVVQQQVAAEAAGVCFTCDPTGKDHAVLIEAAAGLGDKLVSGQVEPQRFRVYRSGSGDWEIPSPAFDLSPSSIKTKQKFFGGSRGAIFQKSPPGRRRQTRGAGTLSKKAIEEEFISIDEIKAIAAKAKELAEKFGHHLDLEWAIDANRNIWWLQARPVTAAAAPPDYIIYPSCSAADDGPVTVWSNWNVRETLPQPLFPFTWTYWRDKLLPVITRHLAGVSQKSHLLPYIYPLDLVHGRIYFNLNAMLAAPFIGSFAHRLISTVDSRAGSTLKELIKKSLLLPRKYPGSKFFLFFSILKASFISFLKILRHLNPQKSMKILADDSRAIAERKALSLLSDEELLEEFNLFARPECSRILYGLQMEIVAMVIYVAAKKAFKKHPEALELLCTGIPANPTTKISIEIEKLTAAAEPFKDLFLKSLTTAELLEQLQNEECAKRSATAANRARQTSFVNKKSSQANNNSKHSSTESWLRNFKHFLENYGHRGPMEFDLGSTRWSDDPTMIIETIRSALRTPGREKLTNRLNRLAKKHELALKKATTASPWWKRSLMRWLARKVESFMPLREAPKHYAVIVFQRIRRAALEIGKRLKEREILPAAEDIFFLEIAEITDLVEGEKTDQIPDKLKERKELYKRFKQETPPGFFRSDGVPVIEEIEFPAQPAEGLLRGTAISGGSAAGPVCILSEPDPSAVQEGDIIVMEYADPGWTPLFPRASGIIMEVGGLMCHAAVVAREIGIPAVFGIANATTILENGQHVILDGSKGTVVLNPNRNKT